MRTQFCGNIFLGIWFPQNLGYFRISQAEEEGSGEESSACSIRFILAKFGADKNTNTSYHKIVSAFLSLYGCPNLKGMHPRHPPRAFPLWLLAPRCPCVSFAHSSWGEEVSSPRVGRYIPRVRGICPRHPHSTLCI
jgi:hypothetical protein